MDSCTDCAASPTRPPTRQVGDKGAFAAGQVSNGKIICGAKNKKAEPCGLSPKKGATGYGRHGGNSPQAKRKAAERIAEQEAFKQMTNALRTLGKPVDVDPGKALLDEIHWAAGHVA